MAEEVSDWGESTKGKIFKFFLGTPLKLWASVGHWALWHFDISKFTQKQRNRVGTVCCRIRLASTLAQAGWLNRAWPVLDLQPGLCCCVSECWVMYVRYLQLQF